MTSLPRESIIADRPASSVAPGSPDVTGVEGATTALPPQPSIWHRPVSYRVQCWVAWAGLTAFGIRGAAAMYAGDAPDVERIAALGLSLCWGIDLLRDRSADR